MKRFVKYLFLSAVISLAVISCQQDDDNDDNPGNVRDNYLGVWDCVENTGFSAPQFYTIDIIAGSESSEIIITGLYNISGTQVQATVDGLMISIPSQTSEGIAFSGSGQANADFNQVNLNFTANDGSGNDVVEAVLTR